METRFDEDISWMRKHCDDCAIRRPRQDVETAFACEVFWEIQGGKTEHKAREDAFRQVIIGEL